ncbi:cullin [Haematococcus lacustris]
MASPIPTALGLRKASQAPAGPANVKKLVIKPLKSKPELPANFEEETWSKLRQAVQAINAKQAVSCSLEELYAAVQDMCMHKMADKLYQRLQQECDLHVSSRLAELCGSLSLDAVSFLDRVDALWVDLCAQLLTIRQVFLYLDRTYVITSTSARSLFDMGLTLLRSHLAHHPQVETHTVAGMLQLVERERGGEAVARPRLHSLVRMFTALGTYPEALQRPLLDASTAFYRAEGDRLVAQLSVPAYLQHCESRLGEEYERCAAYLDSSSRKPLVLVVEQQLVAAHMPLLLDKGLAELLDGQRVEDLGRLYGLTGRVGAWEALRVAWRDYIRTTGLKLVKDEEKDKDMVGSLLALKARLDAVLSASFASSEPLASSLKEAFEAFINQRQNKPAELIAKFMDARLRAGNKGSSEDEVERELEQALQLFRYISGKDVFEAFYKKDLAKRLLLGKSASFDAEKALIAKLKAECGSQFTSKLEGMFKDIELSVDVMTAFKQSPQARTHTPGAVDLQVSVLTSGFWPTYPLMEAKLPKELETQQQVFLDFYMHKYSGRRLQWYNSLGACVLRAAFPKGTKELSVSLFQAVVLCMFNDADALSFQDLKVGSGIEDKELRRTLQSLACGKVRVLNKEPKGKDVGDDDVFHFNTAFTQPLFRIKINAIQMKETEEENKKTNDQVMQDRQYQIDAALVRIMKTRKTLSHKLLIAEALQQLKFPLKALDLKKRIESLIDREYLARDATDANVYNYLA